MDFDDLFFVLLIRIIARSLARFYLPSCPINISIYVFLPHATLKGTSAFLEELNWIHSAQIVCIIEILHYILYTHTYARTRSYFMMWGPRKPFSTHGTRSVLSMSTGQPDISRPARKVNKAQLTRPGSRLGLKKTDPSPRGSDFLSLKRRLRQKLLMDFHELFFVLLTTIMARSLARFYPPSYSINISFYQKKKNVYKIFISCLFTFIAQEIPSL